MAVSAEATRDRAREKEIKSADGVRGSHAAPDRHGTRTDYPRDKSITALFEEQAALAPLAVALAFEDRQVTYGALNEQANRLARRLRDQGVERGTLVGLCVERSPELIVGLLAILKAGGAYVPLDPEYPDSRLRFMIGDTGAPVIVADRQGAGRLAPALGDARVFSIDADDGTTHAESSANLESAPGADDLAYVMYTSGSTGTPKGVMIPHRGVVRLVRNTNYCRFGPEEVSLLFAPISFDASTFEIWGALLNGGRLAIAPPQCAALDQLGAAVRRHGVTTLWLTAGLFNLMVEQRLEDLRPIRQLLAGGDVLSPPHVQKALECLDDGVIINGYGPTESTTFACCHRMSKTDGANGPIPIGRPIANTTVHVLDPDGQPVPAGTVGELWIGGDGLARGYLNQPELTGQKFVKDPFSSQAGARLYRTGDLARERADGNIEFLGRVDTQIKIAGHRIEPGEIEAALVEHPDVSQAVVVADAGHRGEKRLVAYVVAAGAGTIELAVLKDYLSGRLPAFMIPSVIVACHALPLSPNGKVDRSALPPVETLEPGDAPAPAEPAPLSTLEQTIAGVWRQVLDLTIGPEDNFFDLGGDSLQLIEVHSELQKSLGRTVSIMDLFEFTTVRSLAARLGQDKEPEPELAQAQDRASKQRQAMARQKATRAPL